METASFGGYKCHKVARLTRNPYLNFLREYRKWFCGLSPQDLVRYGARQWNRLKQEEKERFRKKKLLKSPPRLAYFTRIQRMRKRLQNQYEETLECHAPPALGSAIGYIRFLGQFERKYRMFSAKALRQTALREWCRLTDSERNYYDEPLWYLQKG